MVTKNKGLDVTYGLVIKQTVTTQDLIWAIHYLITIKNIPAKKISKSSLNKFIKDQMCMFGHNGDSLFGSSYDEDQIDDETYTKIENTIDRIFFQ